MNINKKPLKKIAAIAAIIILIIIILIIIAYSSSNTILVKGTETGFYRVKIIFASGDSLLCLKDSREFGKRETALSSDETDFGISLISLDEISFMEIIPERENEAPPEDGDIPTKYFGKFKVDVSGNIGYLYISRKKGKIFGTIHFPDWANGAYERLKNLWISKGKIGFIRSVDNRAEARRVGVSTYFIQEFYGDYKRKGNMIEGYYINRGVKNPWRAYRIK